MTGFNFVCIRADFSHATKQQHTRYFLNPEPRKTPTPKPYALNPKPHRLNPHPQTLNPKP